MRVDPNAAALQAQLLLGMLKGKDGGPGASFAAATGASPTQPVPTPASGSAAPATSVAMLVAVQAAASTPLPRQGALRRAERGIEALGRLHRLTRAGPVPRALLDELAGWRDEGGAGEGAIGALLDEVELRILVELAKEGR